VDEICLRFETPGAPGRVLSWNPNWKRSRTDRAGLLGELLLLEWSYRAKPQALPPKTNTSGASPTHRRGVVGLGALEAMIPAEHDSPADGQDVSAVGSILLAAAGLARLRAGEADSEGGMGEVFQRPGHEAESARRAQAHHSDEGVARATRPIPPPGGGAGEDAAPAHRHRPRFAGGRGQADPGDGVRRDGSLGDRLGKDVPLPTLDAVGWWPSSPGRSTPPTSAGIVHRDLKPDNVLMADPVAGSPDNVLDGFSQGE